MCIGQHGGKQTVEASEDLMVSLAVVRVLRDQFLRLVQTVPVPMKQSGISSAGALLRYFLTFLQPGLVHLESESGNKIVEIGIDWYYIQLSCSG